MEGYRFTTWNECVSCEPELYFQPSTLDELRGILKRAKENGKRVKVCGGHHTFNTITCTTGYMVDLQKFNRVLDVDTGKKTIRVEAGVIIGALNEDILPKHGLGLSVQSFIPFQSLAGAISTGTHGTGAQFGMMATCLIDIDIMTSSGEIVRCSREDKPDLFSAARCGLGALGVIVSTTIQCEAAFNLHQKVMPLKFDQAITNLDQYVDSGEHVMFFWMPHTDDVTMMAANRTDRHVSPPRKPSWFWDTFVQQFSFDSSYWISDFVQPLIPWINWAFQRLFFSSPAEHVDVSHRIFIIPVPLAYATEWAIPRDKAQHVLRELKEHADTRRFYANTQVIVRFAKADDIMISPAYNKDVCHINIAHLMPYGRCSPNAKFWTIFADVMRKAGGVPHWGKMEEPMRNQDNKKLYSQWEKFCEIRKSMDPDGIFLNEFLEKCITD